MLALTTAITVGALAAGATPAPVTEPYEPSQEYSPGHALDQAKVLGRGGRVDTPFRSFRRTLLTREYSAIDKQAEKKWYARGIGVVQADALTESKEHAELVAVRRP